jgi:hypothetical protein
MKRPSLVLPAGWALCCSLAAGAPEPPPAGADLTWRQGPGYRFAPLTVPASGHSGFTLLPASRTGCSFTNHLSPAAVAENQIRLVGSGVALGDVDGDGWCDVYLCRQQGGNVLYRNRGNFSFADITAQAGVGCPDQFSTGCALADVDGDGDLDLLVNGLGSGTRLFLNDGRGRFTESTASGLEKRFGATSLALADVDGDGDLDLYVANYRTTTIRSTGMKVLNVNGRKVIRPEDRDQYEFTPEGLLLEHGEPDILYLNDGGGHFRQVSWTGGAFVDESGKALTAAPKDWGLSALFRDVNGDGRPDLYVCNDFWSADRFWLNESRDGQVRFRAAPWFALRHTSTFSMGVDFADLNRDGFDDFIVLDMLSRDHPRRLRQHSSLGQTGATAARLEDRPQVERNTLFLNRGDGTFAEIADLAGVRASEWSWSVAFLDVDLDGFEDLLITNGHEYDTQDTDTEARQAAQGPATAARAGDSVLQFPPLRVANCAFRNRGDLTFDECAARWGFDQVGVSHGMALADLDNDGDLDVVVNNLNGAVGIFRNESAAPRLAVRLRGRPPNTRGIGARIQVRGGHLPGQSQQVMAGGRYLSSDEPTRVFAAGTAGGSMTIEVNWSSGATSLVRDARPNRVYEIQEPPTASSPRPEPTPQPAAGKPFFTDVSALLNHQHVDPAFDDFARQPSLPRKLSQAGPGVAWIDIDGDGRDDLVVGTGRGGSLAILHNRGNGAFESMRVGGVLGQAPDDQSTVLGWSPAEGVTELLVGQGNYETADPKLPAVHRFELRGGTMKSGEPIPPLAASPGPLALADIDGDGDLDLFVGGAVRANHYPEPAPARLYRNDSGQFALAQEWPALGLVSGSLFSDLDGDGLPELILACEWGPLRVWRNTRGRLEPWDPLVSGPGLPDGPLSRLTGWWNGVAAGDFDGDGRLDIVASNWGENTPCQFALADGWRIYYGDTSGNGAVDVIEAFTDRAHQRLVPWRDLDALSQAMPWLRERFPRHASFAEASLQDILGNAFPKLQPLTVTWLASTLFLNRGDHFEVRRLPREAQFAPAFGVSVGDYDGDGHEDVFLAQNFFAVHPGEARLDAGRGLWLKGDGRGDFQPVPGPESGVIIYGEQRGAALSDYDEDGRIDLAVGQNNAPTKLFHNERAQPGLRVRLSGPPGNRPGIGAVLRLESAGHSWAAREVHGGSGYWSQDSPVTVLARTNGPMTLSVRWPGGKLTTTAVPPNARELTVNAPE